MVATRYEIIKEWLGSYGSLTTLEIYDLFLEHYPRTCPSMVELGSMLGTCKYFRNIGTHTSLKARHTWKRHAIWELKEEVL